jgi:hypothetical protein
MKNSQTRSMSASDAGGQRKRTRSKTPYEDDSRNTKEFITAKASKRQKDSKFLSNQQPDDTIHDVTEPELIQEQEFEIGFHFKESSSTPDDEISKNAQKEILRQMVRKVLSESPNKSDVISTPKQQVNM